MINLINPENVGNIRNYLIYNIDSGHEVSDFDIEEMIERVLIYTNRTELPTELERILAKQLYKIDQDKRMLANNEVGEVSSISDNGQSISYSSINNKRRILSNDLYLLEGLEPILDRYKLVRVFKQEKLNADKR